MLDKYIVFQICSIIFNCILIHCQDGTEIYGQVANDRKKYASEVGLIRYNKGSETVYCTGTIINSEWLVTSRHCFQSGTEIGTVLVNALSSKDKEAKSIRFSQVVVHGDFQEAEGINDVALVKTESHMDAAMEGVNFAYLMKNNWPGGLRYNRSCRIVHYVRSEGSSEIKLYKDDVFAEAGPSACKCKNFGYAKQPPLGLFQQEAICANSKIKEFSCYTHTEAPLFCSDELVGIGHLVIDCDSTELNYQENIKICKNGRKNLNTFTAIHTHKEWMKSKGIKFPQKNLRGKAANINSLLNLILASAGLCFKMT
ncbi:collagenase-like isoform X1 [Rhodnius prolixus]